jgi:galactokinase
MTAESSLAEVFARSFAREARLVASAPGRVNLLGEHTDYNGGFVLPSAIPQRTHVALAERGDDRVQAWSATLDQRVTFSLGAERTSGGFIDYVQGVTGALREHGHAIRGFDAAITSTVPVGGGLSSSAALQVALLRGLRELFALSLDDVTLAKLAQWGENHIVGAPVGILDQMACHLADEDSALFLDTRTLEYEKVPLPSQAEVVIVDSGVQHSHAGGGYRTRRAECEQAARLLAVRELRDVAADQVSQLMELPEPLGRRARHVVTENARVLTAVDAMRAGDAKALGLLFNESHRSMRDDFEVSVPEVDTIVENAWNDPSVFGARLTGGGFGGAVVCLVERGAGARVGAKLATGGARLLVARGTTA